METAVEMDLALETDRFICSILRGERCAWPFEGDGPDAVAFMKRTAWHGVGALLYRRLAADSDSRSFVPAAILEDLRTKTFMQAIWEKQHKENVTKVLSSLEAAGCEPILLKGSAIAYDLYEEPYLRTRGDSDILVAEAARSLAKSVLMSQGYQPGFGIEGDYVTSQKVFALVEKGVGSHSIDLHWKLNNSPVLAKLFSHTELLRRSVFVPKLEASVRQICPADALVFSCVHRFVHKQVPYYVDNEKHLSSDRLIWVFDIHLLLENMSGQDVSAFLETVKAKGILDICRDGILAAHASFGTLLPQELQQALAADIRPGPISRYLRASSSGRFMQDVLAVPGMTGKFRYLGEHIFPGRDYMEGKYAGAAFAWLPYLYLCRIFGGIGSRIGRFGGAGR